MLQKTGRKVISGTSVRTSAALCIRLLRGCWLPGVLVMVVLRSAIAGDTPSGPSQQPVDYMIVVTGGELLSGAYPDSHTHFLTRTLRPLGLRCVGSMCVDDKQADLEQALRFATGRSPLVIVTGGLGPTDNDITRETLSEFTAIAIREHPDVLQAMARRFGVSADRIRDNLRQQTRVPTRGTYFNNRNGTAVGLVFESADGVVVALPGPPRELQAMVQGELVPYLSRRFGTRLPGCSLTLRFVGLGQSQIDQTLTDHAPLPPDVTVSSQFEGGRVDFTFSLPDDTAEDRARLEELKHKILKHLGDYVYANDDTTLEQCVARLLQQRALTLALAEVGSGGSLAARLSAADGAGRVLAGAYVAPSEQGLSRLLQIPDDKWSPDAPSAQTARLLASSAADRAESGWALAVGEPQRDQSGRPYVQVAFKQPDGRMEVGRFGFRGTGESARLRLTTQLLDQLRRKLRSGPRDH